MSFCLLIIWIGIWNEWKMNESPWTLMMMFVNWECLFQLKNQTANITHIVPYINHMSQYNMRHDKHCSFTTVYPSLKQFFSPFFMAHKNTPIDGS